MLASIYVLGVLTTFTIITFWLNVALKEDKEFREIMLKETSQPFGISDLFIIIILSSLVWFFTLPFMIFLYFKN